MKGLRRVGISFLLILITAGTTLAFVAVGKKVSSLDDANASTFTSSERNTTAHRKTQKNTTENTVVSDAPAAPSTDSNEGLSLSSSQVTLSEDVTANTDYPLHRNISVTLFWAGEEAGDDNKDISNLPSAWDEKWVKHFGGVDDPEKRNGYRPAKFTPRENPFYFALPYNDFDSKGKRKKEVMSIVPWAKEQKWDDDESMLKNRWIKVIKGNKSCYAQWQDVGPFKEDDGDYVFGSATPKSKTNKHAGLDLSPAANRCLGLGDIDTVDWRFVDADAVPDGPWKEIVTTSQVYWK